MDNVITANDLKTRGVSAITEAVSGADEAVISVRGKDRFVVIPIEKYNRLREYELESALNEAKQDLKNGRYKKESVDKHLKRITRG